MSKHFSDEYHVSIPSDQEVLKEQERKLKENRWMIRRLVSEKLDLDEEIRGLRIKNEYLQAKVNVLERLITQEEHSDENDARD